MTVCFSTRAPSADYLGFVVSPEASEVKRDPLEP
jgi:hypothetical protein